MKRLLLAAALYAAAAAPLFAQNAAPAAGGAADDSSLSESPLRLPDTESEVRAVAPRDVAAPLPPLPDVPPPAVAPPLPAAAELAVPESAYASSAAPEEALSPERGDTLVDAEIGAGLWSAVAAKLSIFKPGKVTYALGFSHESADGFAYHDAGEGYSARRSSVNGRADGTAGGADWSLSAAFADDSDGLQGRSPDFYAVSHRYLDTRAAYRRPAGGLAFRTTMDASLATRSLELAAASPDGENSLRELTLIPAVGLDWKRGRLSLSLDGTYDLRGLFAGSSSASDLAHSVRAVVSSAFEYSPSLSFAASVGAASTTSFPVLIPFSISAETALAEIAAFSVSGGFASDRPSLAAAWRANPYLDGGDEPADDARWFTETRLELFGPSGASLRLGADWARSLADSGRLVPVAPPASSTRGLYSYTAEEYETLTASASLRKRFGSGAAGADGAVIAVGWEADLLDPPVRGDEQRVSADFEFRGGGDAYGGEARATVGLSSLPFVSGDFELPVVDLSGFVRISRTARLILELRDVAAAFEGTDGRTLYDPYLSAGFRADARIQISL